jgi:hypothetical protein
MNWKKVFKKQPLSAKGTIHTKGGSTEGAFVPFVDIVDKGKKLKNNPQSPGDLLQKVEKMKNKPASPTAKTAKTPFYSFCSTPTGHFQQKIKPKKFKIVTPDLVKNFRAARPWILEHLPELTAAGWTRRDLFRVGRFKHPCGTWGPAWLSVWTDSDMTTGTGPDGMIIFSFIKHGRQYLQTARKPLTRGENMKQLMMFEHPKTVYTYDRLKSIALLLGFKNIPKSDKNFDHLRDRIFNLIDPKIKKCLAHMKEAGEFATPWDNSCTDPTTKTLLDFWEDCNRGVV